MYPTDNDVDVLPWYKQGWPWLLISLPASAVIGGIITIILATQSPNALVADDYYKAGLAINQETHRLQQATARGIEALLRTDADTLHLELNAPQTALPDTLSLAFIHATRAELDRTVQVQRADTGLYRAASPRLPAGNWYIQLRPEGADWEIRGRAVADQGLQTRLSGTPSAR